MSDMLDCCGCCFMCCTCLCSSVCGRFCIYMPWGRKHQAPEDDNDLEDEVYAAEVERQNQIERDREQRQPSTQTQPSVLPNPNDKAEVKGYLMDDY